MLSTHGESPTGLLIDERTPTGNFNPLYDGQGDIIVLVNSSKKVERTFRYGPYAAPHKATDTRLPTVSQSILRIRPDEVSKGYSEKSLKRARKYLKNAGIEASCAFPEGPAATFCGGGVVIKGT